MTTATNSAVVTASGATRPHISTPRLGFLGVGWIGRNRMQAIGDAGTGEIVAFFEPAREMAEAARRAAPSALELDSFERLLETDLDGIVIATPSAVHAEQSIQSLRSKKAVFCQKPLGRSAAEVRSVLQAAREEDRLLGVDLSYRHILGVRAVHDLCTSGALGEIYAADLVFHNAYGPDKPWFYDRAKSGGGCVMDLGIHLVDLALWNLGFSTVVSATSRLYSAGRPLRSAEAVEDYCEARLDTATGAAVRIACSWRLPAGREAVISGAFYGTKGGAAFTNLDGSFYKFGAERCTGTKREPLGDIDETWGGRAAVAWATKLASSSRFDTEIEEQGAVAEALDAIYKAA